MFLLVQIQFLPPCGFFSRLRCHKGISVRLLASSSTRLRVYLFLMSGRSRSPAQKRSFSVFAWPIGPCKNTFLFLSLILTPRISLSVLPRSPFASRREWVQRIRLFQKILVEVIDGRRRPVKGERPAVKRVEPSVP